jgi:hypothetical protein
MHSELVSKCPYPTRASGLVEIVDAYGQAMTDSKRHANSQVVSLVFGVPNQTVEGSVAIQ